MIGAAALVAAAGGGAAVAASHADSAAEENQAILADAANQLGITPTKLSDALEKALSDRVDAAVAAGRLTKSEGDALKQRMNSGDFPLFGGFHHGFGHNAFFGDLSAAADYLALTEAALHAQLHEGKTLAHVAQAQGKSVGGLVDAMVKAARQRLDDAVSAGRLTQAKENEMLSGLRDRITNLVNGTLPTLDHFGFRHFGFRH